MAIPEPHPFTAVVRLPRDDQEDRVIEPTAHGALHWAPQHDNGFRARMTAVANWVDATRPAAFVTDVSVEVAAFVRLLGVPVIVIALPGKRFDAPHMLVHRLADHIIAAWPRQLYVPPWLRRHAAKTSYVGGISRYDGLEPPGVDATSSAGARVLVLAGAGDAMTDQLAEYAAACPGTTWTSIGGGEHQWVDDPWPQICSADVVVTHAGQGAIADVAAARRRVIVVARPRPYDEQLATATVLHRHRLATVARSWPDTRAWSGLIAQALASDPEKWSNWKVSGAASRAAHAVEATAHRCATAASVS